MSLGILLKNKRIHLFSMLILLRLFFFPLPVLFCQSGGIKYHRNYSDKEYNQQPQNWSILEDKRGVIYVGNHGGLLEFDGVSWRLIDVPNYSVRSMAIDESGILYIGGKNEIGFFSTDSKGCMQYTSLLDYIKNNQRNFGNVWRTHAAKEGIYFWTLRFLFRWNSGQMKVWAPDYLFHVSFTCKGRFFIHGRKIGLLHIVNDSLKLVPGGEKFTAKKIYMMVPYDSHNLLIGTRSKGFYLYDGNNVVPFPTDADDYLKEKQLSYGIRLSSGDFALTTLRGGLVIIDSQGRLKEIFNKNAGLLDDDIKYVFEDSRGNLWLALNNGIAKIEYASPISIYDNRVNLPGIVLSVIRHGQQKDLYAGTTSGLYSLAHSGEFHPVPGMSTICWSLLSVGKSLLAATTRGVFQVEDKNKNNRRGMVIENPSYVLSRSGKDQNRIWVGTAHGLISLYPKNGQLEEEYKFENITQEIRTIVEDNKGNLWLGTLTKGILKVDFPGNGTIHDPVVTHYSYDTSHGLPPGEVHVFWIAGHVMFATDKGIFRFDEKKKAFIPDDTLGSEFTNGSRNVFRLAEDRIKRIWFHSNERILQAIPQPEVQVRTCVINRKAFLRIPPTQVNAIYPDPDGNITWFASNDGLIRYDTTIKKDYDYDFSTLIRRVVINGKPVFDGYKTGNDSKSIFPIIDYKDRNLRFEFAAPFFEDESATQYQYLLQGYDTDWSTWTKETRKDYTNLDSGSHTFRVRAKNVYENLSREAIFEFKVLPPWYQTWWAFSIYAIAAFFMVFFIVKWRSWKLEKEKQRLERIIKERTKEIEEKNEQLEEMDKVKSRFFANISHEFRTPLTLIKGPLEQMLSQPRDDESEKEQKKKLKLMLRNSQRLLHLINQLLDLSKIDSGKMKLVCSQQNIVPFLKGIFASFEILADQNELDLQFHTEEENITLYFDPGKLEKVLYNLLSNAVKFTPPGGRITVTVTKNAAGDDHFPAGFVDISVSDTGIGIPDSQKAHIFDHFYQVDVSLSHERKHKGSGIGLALTKELVSLHHGEIHVRSSEGKESGTEFILRLPMGKEHLKPDEIITDSGAESFFEKVRPDEIPALYMVKTEKEGENAGDEVERIEEIDIESEAQEKNIILVVEDSADVRTYIRSALEPLHTVVEAADGLEGIKKAEEIIPDLIISDIMMPEADGYELCRTLKKDVKTSHIPVILLTAKASEENIIEGLETGADDYITKPFNTKILCARIKNLVDLRSQLQMNLDREMTLQPAEISVSIIDKEFIKDLQTVINKNLSDPDFNVEDLGKKLYMSRATIYRKINALSGKSPTEFIKSYRLKRAAQLLKSKFGSVTEVAFEVGFASRTYFTKCFKEKFHQLPSEFQAFDT
jgi:signal transduction histidine kinase/CheY-like chemotaxis protein/ligand-binding sensor domain-containing protein